MSDLVEFLRARLDEDEEAAQRMNRNRLEHPGAHESWSVERVEREEHIYSKPKRSAFRPRWVIGRLVMDGSSTMAFIARNDPARVLADVAAKRRIVDTYQQYHAHVADFGSVNTLMFVMRVLALPYAAHPDYRQEWAV